MEDKNSDNLRKSSAWENLWTTEDNATKETPAVGDVEGAAKVTREKKNFVTWDKTWYDPQELRPKSIISSEIIWKSRLTSRDANAQNSIAKSPIENDDDFWENLKKRMNEDRDKIPTYKTTTASFPKRVSLARKKRSLFNSESLNLVKRFRAEVVARSDRLSGDNGIFTLSNKISDEDRENVYGTNLTKETSHVGVDNKKKSETNFVEIAINDVASDTDQASPCPTPAILVQELENRNSNRTPSAASITLPQTTF